MSTEKPIRRGMKTLSVDLDVTGGAVMTAKVHPKKGDEFWVCNPMDELIEAMWSGELFVAHKIVGMQPKRVLLDPREIISIEEA